VGAEPPLSPNGAPAPAPPPATPETAMADAIQRVTAHTQALVKDQVDLAKLELQQKATVFGRGTAIGVAAGIFVVGALILILEGFAWLAWYELFPNDQFFWGFFLVAAILLVLAALAGGIAARVLKKAQAPVPQQALDAARQTQETFSEETSLLREQVREVVVKPEDQRS
jgi:uncharacterized membrane protein YqjE